MRIDPGGGGPVYNDPAGLTLPAKVAAENGAAEVDFPWTSAQTALDDLQAACKTLDTQLETRLTMDDSIEDWEGSYRDEFDLAYWRLRSYAYSTMAQLSTTASSIVSGAEDANSAQRTANEEAANPVPAGVTPN